MKIETVGITSKILGTPPRVDQSCSAVVEVQKVIKKDGVIVLVLLVLAATLADQVGRTQTEYLNLPVSGNETAKELAGRLLLFLWKFGLIDEDQVNSDDPVDFDEDQFVGKQAIVQIINRKNQPLQVGYHGVWALGDSDAPFVPSIDEKGDDK